MYSFRQETAQQKSELTNKQGPFSSTGIRFFNLNSGLGAKVASAAASRFEEQIQKIKAELYNDEQHLKKMLEQIPK